MYLGPNNLQRAHLISVEKRCNLHNHSDFSVLLKTVHLDSYKSCLQNIAERQKKKLKLGSKMEYME